MEIYNLTMEEATEKCMSYQELKETYSSFDEYHNEYFPCGDTPKHALQYPVFHNPNDNYEWLTDGWHRLHSYYKNGYSHVPVIEIIQ